MMLRRAARRLPGWMLAVVGLIVLGAALFALGGLGTLILPQRTGPPVEELTVERTTLTPGAIELMVRNSGPDPVQVAQVAVNDTFVNFSGGERPIGRLESARLRLDVPWQSGQPYQVSMLTSTGLVIEHEIPVAVDTPAPGGDLAGRMVLLGVFVGVVPVLLGMLFLPALRRASGRIIRGLLGLTVGLLALLAVEATVEAVNLAGTSGAAFGGVALVALGAGLAFLALTAVDAFFTARRAGAVEATSGPRLALMIAIGIGLHNLGEGLAIGSAYAVGELAVGAALVIGFAVHNTTEGVAVVVPLADRPVSVPRLAGLGLIAGAPAIAGTLLGSTVASPALSALLLGVGAGAILQVIVQIAPGLRNKETGRMDGTALTGLAAGAVLMWATGLLVAV